MAVFCFNVALKEYLRNMLAELDIPRVKVFSLDQCFYAMIIEMTNIGWLDYTEDEKTKVLKTKTKTKIEILPILQSFLKENRNELQATADVPLLYFTDYLFCQRALGQ